MKKMRRFAAIAAAAAMTACMVMPMTSVWAATDVQIGQDYDSDANTDGQQTPFKLTIDNAVEGYTYAAYQVFKGNVTQTTDGDTVTYSVLTDIEWGEGINAEQTVGDKNIYAMLAEITVPKLDEDGNESTGTVTPFDGVSSAAEVAEKLADYSKETDNALAKQFAAVIDQFTSTKVSSTVSEVTNGQYVMENMKPGYYLVKNTDVPDKVEADEDGDGSAEGAYTRFILQALAENTTGNSAHKSSIPSVVKKVKENTDVSDYTYTDAKNSQTDDDYNDVADYNIGDTVSFKLYGTMPTRLDDFGAYFYKFTDTLGKEFTLDEESIVIKVDGEDVADNVFNIHKDVTATLDDDDLPTAATTIEIAIEDVKALSVVPTSASIITVEYNATLNENAAIGLPGQVNEVYLTYSNNPNVEYNPSTSEACDENEDENNTVVESPDDTGNPGDNTGDTPKDVVIVFTYELDVTKVDGADGAALEGAEFVLKNADGEYASVANGIFSGWVDEDKATTLTSDADGKFVVQGLDEGTYYLEETKAPTGYNKLNEDVKVVVTANTLDTATDAMTTINRQDWKWAAETDQGTNALLGLTISVDDAAAAAGDLNEGSVEATVKNNKGSSLPSTGGIGTTLFYVIGGTLAAGAGVGLIAKKRMKNEE